MSPSHHGTSNLTLDSTESSIGEEDGEYFEEEDEEEPSQLEGGEEECLPSVEERRESIEEIVGQLVMQVSLIYLICLLFYIIYSAHAEITTTTPLLIRVYKCWSMFMLEYHF